MEDYLIKALAYDGYVRAYAVQATNTVAGKTPKSDTTLGIHHRLH